MLNIHAIYFRSNRTFWNRIEDKEPEKHYKQEVRDTRQQAYSPYQDYKL